VTVKSSCVLPITFETMVVFEREKPRSRTYDTELEDEEKLLASDATLSPSLTSVITLSRGPS